MCEDHMEEVQETAACASSCHLSYKTCGHVYSSCIGNVILHASETWPLTKPDLQCLQHDRAMIRQICNVKSVYVATIRSNKLLAQLEIDDLDVILRERRLRWFGHVECSSCAIKTACHIQIEGLGQGGQSCHGRHLTERNCLESNPIEVDPCDKDVWRSSVRYTMPAASQLPGREPTDVDDAPVPAY